MAAGASPENMQRLTIMMNAQNHVHHHSLAIELLDGARTASLAGATLLQAFEGQGRSGALHRQHLFREDSPLVVLIVDTAPKIEAFVESIRSEIGDSLVIIEDVTAFRS